MGLDITLVDHVSSRRHTQWIYNLTPTALSAYTTGGETIDFTKAAATGRALVTPYHAPSANEVMINANNGYTAEFNPSTTPTLSNAKLKILSTAATELTNTSYSTTHGPTAIRLTITQSRGKSNSL